MKKPERKREKSAFEWRHYHVQALAEAIRRADALRYPADSVLRQFFREHSSLGQRDRAFVAEGVFACLRRRRSLKTLTQTTKPQRLALAVLVREFGYALREAEALADAADREWLKDFDAHWKTSEALLSDINNADVPDELWARLNNDYDAATCTQLTQAWTQPAPFDLRVNVMKTTRDEALAALRDEGWQIEPTPYSPLGIRVHGRPMLAQHPWLVEGKLEVQSESSQLVGMLVAPRRGEMVADFCAGAGGKTLLLGMLMRSQGRLYAFDVLDKRLKKLTPRLARSGLSNVHPQRIDSERDAKLKRLAGKMDRVLVDAPCTGTGTLQRNPDMKWRYSEAGLAELNAKQTAILTAAAKLVKPGGRLVYATCSVLSAENEAIVAQFLSAHPEFSLQPAAEALARAQVPLDTGETFKLLPHEHHTDGFFAAVMVRDQESEKRLTRRRGEKLF
ncbi:MAG: RsmB/NOP family class I SAM-dependent RNA methyltransferase [Burkholderiales bacterium]|jgi:16S rRNA (cytosine967-C5)-methyltransferase|nr:RsmB/NOP family class I SAM-dependent RNA methyltransferase [Burkholderiales bacterium]